MAAVTVFAAACGGGGGSANAKPATSATDYLTCLRDNGVNVPQTGGSRGPRGSFSPGMRPSGFPSGRPSGVRPSGSGRGGGFGGLFGSQAPPGVDQSTWDKALKACAALRPSGIPQGRDNGANAAYRNCLTDHGVTASSRIEDLPASDPKVAAALQACAALRPSSRPGPAPTPSR
jgi:hypothetical protein